ncbi:MAG: lysine biosynthesis protein LysW [Candidatus Shapirobacteria bacterium]|jgi:alpha-aminoadipate carrier protein LysW
MIMKLQSKIVCPDCQTDIAVINPLNIGDILECLECGTEVEVISLDPLKYRELIEEK